MAVDRQGLMTSAVLPGSNNFPAGRVPQRQFHWNHLVNPVTYNAAATAVDTVTVLFGTTLGAVSSTTTNYSISGPSAVTVNAVNFTAERSYFTLTVTSAWAAGTYVLTITSGAVTDVAGRNATGTASFAAATTAGGGSNFNTGFN